MTKDVLKLNLLNVIIIRLQKRIEKLEHEKKVLESCAKKQIALETKEKYKAYEMVARFQKRLRKK